MEGSYYNNPTFPYALDSDSDDEKNENEKVTEFNENRYSLNDFKEKKVVIYASFNNSMVWRDKVFEGVIKDIQNHYILLSDEKNLLIIPINFINFIEIK